MACLTFFVIYFMLVRIITIYVFFWFIKMKRICMLKCSCKKKKKVWHKNTHFFLFITLLHFQNSRCFNSSYNSCFYFFFFIKGSFNNNFIIFLILSKHYIKLLYLCISYTNSEVYMLHIFIKIHKWVKLIFYDLYTYFWWHYLLLIFYCSFAHSLRSIILVWLYNNNRNENASNYSSLLFISLEFLRIVI